MASQTFIGAEIYSAITIGDAKLAYKADSRLGGQFYHSGRWGTRGFTCSESFYKDFKNQNIAQLSMEESSYKVMDTNTGQEIDRQSANVMGYVTFDGKINIIDKMSRLKVAEAKAAVVEKHATMAAIAELGLNEKDIKLMEELTGVTMKELMASA